MYHPSVQVQVYTLRHLTTLSQLKALGHEERTAGLRQWHSRTSGLALHCLTTCLDGPYSQHLKEHLSNLEAPNLESVDIRPKTSKIWQCGGSVTPVALISEQVAWR
jgi:hypothetical protein